MLRWPRTAPVLLRRAAGLLERARKNSSLRGYATLRLGMVHGQWSRDHERTLSLLLDAFAALQGSLRARLALVEYLRFLGQEERALVLLESWLGTGSGKGPSSLLWREVGNRLAEEGARCQPGFVRGGEDRFPSTALDYYKRASEGGDTEAAWKAGELFADMDDEAGAYLWVASYALKHCRDHPERLFRLGQWAHRSYRFAEAARLLDLAVEGDPGLASRRHHFPDPER
jgi:hypothetical protein